MPGALQGAVEGFAAGQSAQHDAALEDLESRRLAAEQQNMQFEQGTKQFEMDRMKTRDALEAVTQQQGDIATAGKDAWNYMGQMPDATKDPIGFQEWWEKPETQQNHKTLLDLDQQTQDLTTKRDQLLQTLGGAHIDQAKRQADRTAAAWGAGQTVANTPAGDVANFVALRSRIPADQWKVDATGRMPVSNTLDNVDHAFQTNDFSKIGNTELQAIYPDLSSTVINHNIPGLGVATGLSLTPGAIDKDDPNKIYLHQVIQYHDPVSGDVQTTKPGQLPDIAVARDAGAQQLGRLHKMEQYVGHNDVQQKVTQAFNEGSTFMHQFNNDLAAAGIDKRSMLPAPWTWQKAGAGQTLVAVDAAGHPVTSGDGQPVTIQGQHRPYTSGDIREQALQTLQDPEATDDDKAQAKATIDDLGLGPRTGVGGGRGGFTGRYGGAGGAGGVSPNTPYGKPVDDKEIEASLDSTARMMVLQAGGDLSTLEKGENPFSAIKDPQQRLQLMQRFERISQTQRRDLQQGDRSKTSADYLGSTGGDPAPLKVGDVIQWNGGYHQYTGGDPRDRQNNWKDVAPPAGPGVPAAPGAAPAAPAQPASPAAAPAAPVAPQMTPQQQEAQRVRGYADAVDPKVYMDVGGGRGGLGGRSSSGRQRLDSDIADAQEKIGQLADQVKSPPKGMHGWQLQSLPDHLKAQQMRLQELVAVKQRLGYGS